MKVARQAGALGAYITGFDLAQPVDDATFATLRMSLLLARRVPPYGGDTMFANQHLGYEAPSPALQRVLEGLRAVHSGTELAAQEKGLTRHEVTAVHPVVRKHPDTGRKALFVNADYTRHFTSEVDMTTAGNVQRKASFVTRLTDRVATSPTGQKIYARLVPPIDRRLLLWTRGTLSLSPGPGVALLTTKGAKTGKLRRTPAGHALDGNNVIFIASNGGSPHHPAWFYNVRVNPEVEILRKGGHRGRYRAEEVPAGPERERLWKLALEVFPGFDDYAARTGGRVIPVVRCTPI